MAWLSPASTARFTSAKFAEAKDRFKPPKMGKKNMKIRDLSHLEG